MGISLMNVLLILNLLNPTEGLSHRTLPDWLAAMNRPALEKLCLTESHFADKRILAAAALFFKHRDSVDFKALAAQVKHPVLKRDLLGYAGQKTGAGPVFQDGLPRDILYLPTDTKAVLFYSDHLRERGDIPEKNMITFPGRMKSIMDMMYFSAFRASSFFRLDSLTLGGIGKLPDVKFGRPVVSAVLIARGTFDRQGIIKQFRSGGMPNTVIDGIKIFRNKNMAAAFPNESTAVFVAGTEGSRPVRKLLATVTALRTGKKRLLKNRGLIRILRSHMKQPGYLNLVFNSRTILNSFVRRELDSTPFSGISGADAISFCLYSASAARFRVRIDNPDNRRLRELSSGIRGLLDNEIRKIRETVDRLRNKKNAEIHLKALRLPQFLAYLNGFRYSTRNGSFTVIPEKPCNLGVVQFLSGTIRHLPMIIGMMSLE